ncbi:putative C4-dicarboxylate transport protein [Nitrospira sp. KM1]|uniref:dicarboxylate/amino acid:cation symporter n=1 Tax=Nitrospira sp. KM1 TaxID=1936990 RepID=UPI0013A79B0B|nr:dicarboxylate/amino acid:cation symporter [Nitrospira sp. KM1]BCA56404.1 putative C4-dicarboxylate transport protein [Nitrospira sp. KM1]
MIDRVPSQETSSTSENRSRLPLYTQVLIAVACGTLLGILFGQQPYLFGLRNEHLGKLGLFVITVLKTLAIPLIFFAILDSFLRTNLPLRQGTRLIAICLINVTVAMTIGLLIMNLWEPGLSWKGRVEELLNVVPDSKAAPAVAAAQPDDGNAFERIASYIPRTMLQPFSSNNVIGVVILALLLGVTFRRLHAKPDRTGSAKDRLAWVIERIYQFLVKILEWIILVVPFAVFGVLAYVVGRSGAGVFPVVAVFLAAIMAGLTIHAFVYYPLVAWLIGRKTPKEYIGKGADAIMTAVSCNSSLATVPVTLRCLDRMHVSPESARLAACVGTNLNNDGITLYEAMAALFLAQALGYDLPVTSQLLIVLASIMAGAGVAGIPEAGLIVLPLVLSAAGLPDHVIVAAIPLIMTVDWILARARSGVNVMSDMLVAILLDAVQQRRQSGH